MSPDTVSKLEPFTLPLTVDGTRVEVAGLRRDGTGTPLVFLHGFGSTKEDYADVIQQEQLAGRPVLAYDAPGCGGTTCSDLDAVSVPFLVTVAERVLRAQQIDRFHLVGHSMGGLTALLLADRDPGRVASLVSIEGNVAPEDCFLSRQIVTHADDDPDAFLTRFAERVAGSRFYSGGLYAASLPYKVRSGAVRAIFESMVDLSDHGNLLDRFLGLPLPRMFMYGEQNDSLSYLPKLAEGGVELAEISHSAHFPMYSNPPQMWARITGLVARAEAGA
ncbi:MULTISPECIES: alpha/beta fold hydrolase [Streptomyces]|uniref:Alpha/beta hydrolase n=1 Tax=Streptomyces koelreuteriae TaxID=2838015 RepID=A0ABX8FJ91_9ACTN|nr:MULTISPECIES: alpha/beta hydrolase [Streptomyces]QWB21190.1 alpha/beta hydrolase [Streptomyces koelreuteriae]UUA04105.1 alpha/beta hydrolase [Streptomyces koelreuteriae]UUA11731.1 alpha/beta hydrolase [Streptomyces sp. CRCS-T-1]